MHSCWGPTRPVLGRGERRGRLGCRKDASDTDSQNRPWGSLSGLFPSHQTRMHASAPSLSSGPLGQLSLWNLLYPMAVSVTLAEPLEDAPRHWSSLGIIPAGESLPLQGKSLPANSVGVGAPGTSNLRAAIFKIIFLLKQCRLPGEGKELSERGKRKKGAIITLQNACRGLKTLASRFPCPGKQLRQFSNNPKCMPTWAGYEYCLRYKTIIDCIMKSN